METTKKYRVKVTREYITYLDVFATTEEEANEQIQKKFEDGSFYSEELNQMNIQGEEIHIYTEEPFEDTLSYELRKIYRERNYGESVDNFISRLQHNIGASRYWITQGENIESNQKYIDNALSLIVKLTN